MRNLTFLSVIAFTCAVALNAQSISSGQARLVARSGIVEVQRDEVWQPLLVGDLVNSSERVRTASASTAALQIGYGKVVTLAEATEVQLRPSNGSLGVQLESGNARMFSDADIRPAAKDVNRASDVPLEAHSTDPTDNQNGMLHRNYTVSEAPLLQTTTPIYTVYPPTVYPPGWESANPTFYVFPAAVYPGFGFGRDRRGPGPNSGAIVPPVVKNPTNPAYRPTQIISPMPTQIIPPMSDPIRVHVKPQ